MFIKVGDSYENGEKKTHGLLYTVAWRHTISTGWREGPLLQENISLCFWMLYLKAVDESGASARANLLHDYNSGAIVPWYHMSYMTKELEKRLGRTQSSSWFLKSGIAITFSPIHKVISSTSEYLFGLFTGRMNEILNIRYSCAFLLSGDVFYDPQVNV